MRSGASARSFGPWLDGARWGPSLPDADLDDEQATLEAYNAWLGPARAGGAGADEDTDGHRG